MTTVTNSLPESLKTFVEGQVAAKGYGNVSEYFRSLLREPQPNEAEARLETLPLDAKFLAAIEAKTTEILDKYKGRKLP